MIDSLLIVPERYANAELKAIDLARSGLRFSYEDEWAVKAVGLWIVLGVLRDHPDIMTTAIERLCQAVDRALWEGKTDAI